MSTWLNDFFSFIGNMNFDFSVILFTLCLITGCIYLIDKLFFRKQRLAAGVELIEGMEIPKEPWLIGTSRSLFSVFLIVFLLRSFLVEPFRIPSGSMIPSLLIGDFILVNKYTYGIRLPVINKKIINISEPKRGDVLVFRYPVNPSINFIKRVIGVPGDTIKYVNKKLYINGKLIPEERTKSEISGGFFSPRIVTNVYLENLGTEKHLIQEVQNDGMSMQVFTVKVPKGEYFVLGDNRDNSEDSRYWGFVPEKNIVGKAFAVWLSWDSQNWSFRWKHAPSWIT